MKRLEPLRPKRKLDVDGIQVAEEVSPAKKQTTNTPQLPPLELQSSVSDISDISEQILPCVSFTIETGEISEPLDSVSQREVPGSWPPPSTAWSEESYKSQTRVILQENKHNLQKLMQSLKELVAARKIDHSKSKTFAKLIEDHVTIIQELSKNS